TVLTPDNAPSLAGVDDAELSVLQSRAVAYRGQFVAAAVASTIEAARDAADLIDISYAPSEHALTLRADHPGLYAPDHVNPNYETDTAVGDFIAAFDAAEVRVDATYRTPGQHNNPMEPHATLAVWDGDHLTLFESTQGPSRARTQI